MNKYYCINYVWTTSSARVLYETAAIDKHPVDWLIEALHQGPDDMYALISSYEINYDQYIELKELV